jgi:quercetin dioxygenase-like cupin family protein
MDEGKEVWVKPFREEELGPVKGIKGKFKRFINPKKPGQRLVAGLGILAPGEDMGWHSHPEEEVFIAISGRGLVRWKVDGQLFEADLPPLCAFYKEGGIPHQMLNPGDEPFVGIFAKAALDD